MAIDICQHQVEAQISVLPFSELRCPFSSHQKELGPSFAPFQAGHEIQLQPCRDSHAVSERKSPSEMKTDGLMATRGERSSASGQATKTAQLQADVNPPSAMGK